MQVRLAADISLLFRLAPGLKISKFEPHTIKRKHQSDEMHALSETMDDLFHWTEHHHTLKELHYHAKSGAPTPILSETPQLDGATSPDYDTRKIFTNPISEPLV